jgi:choline dehydrogenase
MEFDYVIVGAGSAGCVLANRLSADPGMRVLLLEAGPRDGGWKIEMPAALTYNLMSDRVNWYYQTEPQRHMDGRQLYWPRGRVLGGSSSLNAMVYIRGHALDYDRWVAEGATGWSYAEVLPYFRRAETFSIGPDAYRGGDGPLTVTRGTGDNPLFDAWIAAGEEAGYPATPDMNGYRQ